MITAHGNMQLAVEALKAGAFDFVSKPVDLPVLRRLVETALRLEKPAADHQEQPGDGDLIGKSPAMADIRRLIDKLARNQAPVFVSGESGTGKELAGTCHPCTQPARRQTVRRRQLRRDPQELMESEFFGHVKAASRAPTATSPGCSRAPTAAPVPRRGRRPAIVDAGEAVACHQEKSVRPVGSAVGRTGRYPDYQCEPQEPGRDGGQWRVPPRPVHRIHVIELVMSPLRERREDIGHDRSHPRPPSQRTGMSKPRLDPRGTQGCSTNTISRATCANWKISSNGRRHCANNMIRIDDLGVGAAPNPDAVIAPTDAELPTEGLEEYLANVERRVITLALETTRWNRTAAARCAGHQLSRVALSPRKARPGRRGIGD